MNVVEPGPAVARSAAGISLRGHQEEALEAIVRGLTSRPGQPASPGGLRAGNHHLPGPFTFARLLGGRRIAGLSCVVDGESGFCSRLLSSLLGSFSLQLSWEGGER
ncbi:hypothetical protein GCM10025734_15870 [Kitasatospora paranensis]